MSTRRLPATIALVAWTLLVWTSRIGNIWGDAGLTTGEKWGRTGLALSFTALALAAAHAVWHRTRWRDVAVKVLAGWTIGVWAVRSVGIAAGDHSGAFVAVHLVLAIVSIALSVLATRESARVESGRSAPSPSTSA
jgi:hypothetical protein